MYFWVDEFFFLMLYLDVGRRLDFANLICTFSHLGICFEWLCSPTHCDDPNRSVMCLKALETLLQSQVPSSIIGANVDLAIEIATVMHR